jgi:hypothetical protein
MRRIISAILVAVSLVTVTAAGTVAQSEPTTEQAIIPAGFNADKVDGRHAVGHGASARKRAGKLVATNKRGQLPSNIVKPAWRLILGKPAAFRDGRITWGEVQNKPGGFADGVDNSHRNTLVVLFDKTVFTVNAIFGFGGMEVPSPNVHISVEPITPDRKLVVRDVSILKSSVDGTYRANWDVQNLDSATSSASFRVWITDFGTGPNGPTVSQIKAARSLEQGKIRKRK